MGCETKTHDAKTLRTVIDTWAQERPDDTWLISPENGQHLTFGELAHSCRQVAQRIASCGITPSKSAPAALSDEGETIAIASPNSIKATLAFLGALYGGFRATPINLVAGTKAIAHALTHSNTRLLLLADEASAPIDSAMASLTNHQLNRIKVVRLESSDSHKYNPNEWGWSDAINTSSANTSMPTTPLPHTIALLLYTSGTTGTPKGVLLSHANLLAAGANVALTHRLTREDRAMCVLPTYHINGLCVSVMGTLVSGGSLVLAKRFSTQKFWQQVTTFACTWSSLVPTLFAYLLSDEGGVPQAKNPLRFTRSASAPLAPETQKAFEKKFSIPIIETMGLTETGAQILSNPYPEPKDERKIGSAGIAFGNEVIIGDSNGRAVKTGCEGEILVRGENVMQGYLNKPEATKEAFTDDGWLRTGDLARMDDQGYVFVTGRSKELIIKGGENIAPREVDETLLAHSAILEAAAFARPCPQYGQRVEACVIRKQAANKESKTDEQLEAELISHCQASLGKFKSPERIHIVDTMPKGPSGKVQRLQLLATLNEAEARQ